MPFLPQRPKHETGTQPSLSIPKFLLPFADAASDTLPLPRLLRLSLFQVSVGIVTALLTGAVNRVMIVELAVPATLVALMVALPLVFAPFRALIGHRSDNHVSYFGWRRGPYIWFGGLLQFGGLAIMPFALLVLSEAQGSEVILGTAAGALAFLLVGAGLHTTQTSGLALATDLAPEDDRPKVVALLYVMLLVGMALGAAVFSFFLSDFTPVRLIKVIQATAVVSVVLNVVALWKQEAPNLALTAPERERTDFASRWHAFRKKPNVDRILISIGMGAAAFAMQDVLLEPYGGEVLGMSVSETTILTALFALGTIGGFSLAARRLASGAQSFRTAALGILFGLVGFSAIILSGPFSTVLLFQIGVAIIGFGGGTFSVCTMTAIMDFTDGEASGIALGAWGAVQATCAGLAIAVGGAIRDALSSLAEAGILGPALSNISVGYVVVYHIEILLLFVSLAIIGPLARYGPSEPTPQKRRLTISAFPQ